MHSARDPVDDEDISNTQTNIPGIIGSACDLCACYAAAVFISCFCTYICQITIEILKITSSTLSLLPVIYAYHKSIFFSCPCFAFM